MKIENGLAILARQNPMTEEDWFTLVEIRKDMLLDSMRDMTLGTMGDLKIAHDYFGTHNIKRDTPLVYGAHSLDIRGIFPPDDNWAAISSNTEYHRDNSGRSIATTERFWGLTRNGMWITIEVYITVSQKPYKYEGRTEEVAKVERVTVDTASLSEVCLFSKRSPEYIWKRLGQVAKDWAKHRKQLYEDAKNLEEEILREEAILEVLSGK